MGTNRSAESQSTLKELTFDFVFGGLGKKGDPLFSCTGNALKESFRAASGIDDLATKLKLSIQIVTVTGARFVTLCGYDAYVVSVAIRSGNSEAAAKEIFATGMGIFARGVTAMYSRQFMNGGILGKSIAIGASLAATGLVSQIARTTWGNLIVDAPLGEWTSGGMTTAFGLGMRRREGLHRSDDPVVGPAPASNDVPDWMNAPQAQTAGTVARVPSSAFVIFETAYAASLKANGRLDDIVYSHNLGKPVSKRITREDLASLNGLTPDLYTQIRVGQTLLVPHRVNGDLVVDYGDVRMSINVVNGTYEYVIADPEGQTTAVFTRAVDLTLAPGYLDRYIKINNVNDEILECDSRIVRADEGLRYDPNSLLDRQAAEGISCFLGSDGLLSSMYGKTPSSIPPISIAPMPRRS